MLEQSSGNAGPWRRQHQGLQAGVPQELPPEPEILQERRHGPAGEEARRQVVRRHRHGHHPWQRSHVAAGPPSIIIVVVVVAKEAVACCSHGEDDGEAEEGGEGVLSPEEEDEQRRDREAAGEEADQGAAGDGARRRAPQRRLAAPRGHGLRRPPARAGRRAPPRLQRHATETIVPPHGRSVPFSPISHVCALHAKHNHMIRAGAVAPPVQLKTETTGTAQASDGNQE